MICSLTFGINLTTLIIIQNKTQVKCENLLTPLISVVYIVIRWIYKNIKRNKLIVTRQVNNMMNRDWERFGEDIRRTVQDAVDSRDFNRLNQTISNTINNAMQGLDRSLHNVGDVVDRSAQNYKNKAWKNGRGTSGGDTYNSQNGAGSGDLSWVTRQPFQTRRSPGEAGERQDVPGLFARTVGTKVKGVALAVTGYTLAIGMFLFMSISLIVSLVTSLFGSAFQIAIGAAGLFLIAGVVLAVVGSKMLRRVKRFRAYVSEMEGRDYGEIQELAQGIRKSCKFVIKDLEKMIKIGWFCQGHLDEQKTCLIVSNETFEQYTELMERVDEQKEEEKLAEEQKAAHDSKISPEVQEIIKTGNEYIEKIRKSNDAIPGEEISAKISRMETLVGRIFERVGQSPENVPDIRRLMEYYLPTTVKLLEAYEDLDGQPVQGENIITSKKEIEGTLDTLNAAFEKLLDSLFQDTAWNLSADISVLNTMLAQEGLTKDDFKK